VRHSDDRTTTVKFILPDLRPQNSPDIIPVDCQTWGVMQDRVYQILVPAEDVAILRQCFIYARCKALSTVLLINDIPVRDFRPMWMKKEAG